MPKRTETINLFTGQELALAASVESPIMYFGNLGADTNFELDLQVTRPGQVKVTQRVGASPGDTFYTPTSAAVLASNHTGGASTASRERYLLNMVGTEWSKLKFREMNASNVTITQADLIISKP